MFTLPIPDLPYLNTGVLREPLNWAIVFVAASIALLGFHVVMTGFGAMSAGGQPAYNAPGQLNIPQSTANFSQPGILANSAMPDGLNTFFGGGIAAGDGTWTGGIEAKYAEDGWGSL